MSLTLGGKTSGNSPSGTTCVTSNFDVVPTVGQPILVGIRWFNSPSISPVITDNATGGSNVYTQVGAPITLGGVDDTICIYSTTVINVNAGGHTITATFISDGGNVRISAVWVAGGWSSLELYKGSIQAPGVVTSDGTTTTNLGTPTNDNSLVFAISSSLGWPDNYNVGIGYTLLHDLNMSVRTVSEYLVQGSKSAVAGTFTQDATNTTLTVGVVVVPSGSPPAGASKLGKGIVNNYPFPDNEKDWDYANTLALGTASPGIIPIANPQIPDPHQITNPLIIPDIDFIDYKSVRAKGQKGAITGLPRKNFTDINSMTAISMQTDIDGFQSMYGVRVSHPSQGTIPIPVSPSVIQGNGMVGAGTMRGD